ncbi:MAG: M48 family metallopeptidase [Bacteriovoracaceae bacterium]
MKLSVTNITILFLTFFFIKEVIEFYLEWRNKKHIKTNRASVPSKFKEKITLEDHQKAADYSITKINVSSAFNLISIALFLFWTIGGGINLLDNHIVSWELGPITTGICFFLAFGFISMIISLPQSLYSTFVVEEKYGFNKTTMKTFIMDRLKGLIIGLIIGVPLLALILWITQTYPKNWWILAFIVITAFQFLMLWAYPVLIAPLFNKFSPMEEGDVKQKVLALLERTGFKSNGLFVMNASMRSAHGNAYFTGFGKNKRIVFFDTLINTLEPDEVEAVLAHELGHYKKKHVLKMLTRSVVMGLIGFWILGQLFNEPLFYQGHGVEKVSAHAGLLLFSLVSGVYTFFLTPIMSFISRKYEFEADEFAAQNSQGAKLISALIKMYKDNASTLTPDPVYSGYHHSHPPALVRVSYIEGLIS